MKHLEILGLLAMVAIGLVALPTDAIATGSVFCTTQESPCPEASRWSTGTELDLSLKSGTKAKLVTTEGETIDECSSSTAKGKIEKAEAVTGPIESLTWSGCALPTKTLATGKLEVLNIAGTHNGTVKADSTTEVTVSTIFFGNCVYGATPGNDLGELKEGKPATFLLNAVLTKLTGSEPVCPETANGRPNTRSQNRKKKHSRWRWARPTPSSAPSRNRPARKEAGGLPAPNSISA